MAEKLNMGQTNKMKNSETGKELCRRQAHLWQWYFWHGLVLTFIILLCLLVVCASGNTSLSPYRGVVSSRHQSHH